MAYQNRSAVNLTSLSDLKHKIDAYADLCLPDFVYRPGKVEMTFYAADVEGQDYPSLAIRNPHVKDDQGTTPYLFTDWSRTQLLSRLGASEKWFRNVSIETQIDELNMRMHCLSDMKVRTVRSADEETVPFRAVRGMVSKVYTDIPDTHIVDSLMDAAGDSVIVDSLSGKTDRAFYAYLVTRDQIEIPGTSFSAWPGIIIRNSEVGYSSLSVMLFLYVPSYKTPIVFKEHTLLKKIHRGKVNELPVLFGNALEEASGLWGSLEEKMHKLSSITYHNEDAAIAALEYLVERVGGTRAFAQTCTRFYKSVPSPIHNAAGIFRAILASTEHIREDKAFDDGRLAGALLLLLTR